MVLTSEAFHQLSIASLIRDIPDRLYKGDFHMLRGTIRLTVVLGVALLLVSSAAMAQYELTNLDSNQVGDAKHVDPLLVNAWGLADGPGFGQRPNDRMVDNLQRSRREARLGGDDSIGQRIRARLADGNRVQRFERFSD